MICKASSSGSEKWLCVLSQMLPSRGRMWKKATFGKCYLAEMSSGKKYVEKQQIQSTPGFGIQQEVEMLASARSCLRGSKESGILSNIY